MALDRAGKTVAGIGYFDFYSCFAIPVFNAIDHLGVAPDDPRGLTLTGGLPFFGGAGNNYSAHAIAEAVQRVRANRGAFALVGATSENFFAIARKMFQSLLDSQAGSTAAESGWKIGR